MTQPAPFRAETSYAPAARLARAPFSPPLRWASPWPAAGIDVVTEKPMTTTADKCRNIVDAARASSARLIMGFNYRHGSVFTKVKELLSGGKVGDVTSVDFNWYLNNYHGASYFRRWHGIREKSGTLLLHKAAHHFDLLYWWIGSDPWRCMPTAGSSIEPACDQRRHGIGAALGKVGVVLDGPLRRASGTR